MWGSRGGIPGNRDLGGGQVGFLPAPSESISALERTKLYVALSHMWKTRGHWYSLTNRNLESEFSQFHVLCAPSWSPSRSVQTFVRGRRTGPLSLCMHKCSWTCLDLAWLEPDCRNSQILPSTIRRKTSRLKRGVGQRCWPRSPFYSHPHPTTLLQERLS